MNTYRDLAIKLFGLLCFLKFVAIAPNTILMFRYIDLDDTPIHIIQICAAFFPLIVYSAGAWICIMKTNKLIQMLWKSDNLNATTQHEVSAKDILSIGIILIGLYYFTSSASTIGSLLWSVRNHKEIWSDSAVIFRFVPTFLQFPIAIMFILKSNSIAEYIFKKQSIHLETE